MLENGKKAYDHICNAQPLENPQYSDDERAKFNIEFSKLIPEIIENWNKLLKPVKAACFMYTLIENAKLNGLVPYEYLRCLFEQVADLDENSNWSKLLPWSIKITPWKDLGQW